MTVAKYNDASELVSGNTAYLLIERNETAQFRSTSLQGAQQAWEMIEMALANHRFLLENIVERERIQRMPNAEVSLFFELFVADLILKDCRLSDEQLEEGNPGGSNDGGIDGAYLIIDGVCVNEDNVESIINSNTSQPEFKLHIMQAKYKDSLEESVIEKLSSSMEDLLDLTRELAELQDHYNSGVIRIFETFKKAYLGLLTSLPRVAVLFSYASKGGEPTATMQHKAGQLCQKISSDLVPESSCEFQFLGAMKLFQLIQVPPKQSFELRIAEGPFSAGTSRSFVALIRLRDFYQFLIDDEGKLRNHLFEANVRDWQGDNNKVNLQIKQSLQDDDFPNFWWLNNGVTILAAEAQDSGAKILTLQKPEIVNGLQTSRAIYQHFLSIATEPVGNPDDRMLLARIIVVPEQDDVRERIIRATNRQTAVPDEALRSLDPVQRIIEEFFVTQNPQLFYERRSRFYKNQGKRAAHIFSIKRLSQCVLATLLFRPEDAKRRPTDYLRPRSDNVDSDERYRLLFNDDYPHEMYFACALFYIRVGEALRSEMVASEYDPSSRRDVLFFVMTHAILRHLNIYRKREKPPAHLITRQAIDAIDDENMVNSANRVLDLLQSHRQQNEPHRVSWRQFEIEFFKDLDRLLPGGDSAQIDQPK